LLVQVEILITSFVYQLSMREIIWHLIKKKSLTQRELARRVGVSENTLGRFLNGRHDLNLTDFCAVLRELDFPLDEILRSHLDYRDNRPSGPGERWKQLRQKQSRSLEAWMMGRRI
jgi:transcriptional regulator with XRE-family HTH domain